MIRKVVSIKEKVITTISGQKFIQRETKVQMPNGKFRYPVDYYDAIPETVQITAEDEKDVQGRATRRFQFYSDFTLSVVSSNVFQHFRNDHLSLYILVNKRHVQDCEAYKNEITKYVAKAMCEFG